MLKGKNYRLIEEVRLLQAVLIVRSKKYENKECMTMVNTCYCDISFNVVEDMCHWSWGKGDLRSLKKWIRS